MYGSTSPGERFLSEKHRYVLEVESKITPPVIKSRGYWSATTVAELKTEEGIAPNQYHAPALVLPVFGINGKYHYSRIRPDNPPPHTGKYIQPSDTPNVLDVPRIVLDKVLDPDQSL